MGKTIINSKCWVFAFKNVQFSNLCRSIDAEFQKTRCHSLVSSSWWRKVDILPILAFKTCHIWSFYNELIANTVKMFALRILFSILQDYWFCSFALHTFIIENSKMGKKKKKNWITNCIKNFRGENEKKINSCLHLDEFYLYMNFYRFPQSYFPDSLQYFDIGLIIPQKQLGTYVIFILRNVCPVHPSNF